MTSFEKVERCCHVCGATSVQPRLRSSNAFGSPDLDTRPPEMLRSTLHVQIEVCPSCRYCAPDLSRGPTTARATVLSPGYKIQAAAVDTPDLARSYLCHGLVASEADDPRSAALSTLRAAWVSDDAGSDSAARRCRRMAAARFDEARAKGVPLSPVPGEHDALVADLLRRSGDFAGATERAGRALALLSAAPGALPEPLALVRRILQFEIRLSQAGDDSCHRVSECAAEGTPAGKPDPEVAKQVLTDLLLHKIGPEEAARRMGVRIAHEVPGSPAAEPPGGTRPGVHIPPGVPRSLEPKPEGGGGIPLSRGFLVPYLHAMKLLGSGVEATLVREYLERETPRWEWKAAAGILRMFHAKDPGAARIIELISGKD